MKKNTKYLVWYNEPYEGFWYVECETLKEARAILKAKEHAEFITSGPKPTNTKSKV